MHDTKKLLARDEKIVLADISELKREVERLRRMQKKILRFGRGARKILKDHYGDRLRETVSDLVH